MSPVYTRSGAAMRQCKGGDYMIAAGITLVNHSLGRRKPAISLRGYARSKVNDL